MVKKKIRSIVSAADGSGGMMEVRYVRVYTT